MPAREGCYTEEQFLGGRTMPEYPPPGRYPQPIPGHLPRGKHPQPMSWYPSGQQVQTGFLPRENDLVNRGMGSTTDQLIAWKGNIRSDISGMGMSRRSLPMDPSFNPFLHNNGQRNTMMPHRPAIQTGVMGDGHPNAMPPRFQLLQSCFVPPAPPPPPALPTLPASHESQHPQMEFPQSFQTQPMM